MMSLLLFAFLVRFNISPPSFNAWLARFNVWLARFNVSPLTRLNPLAVPHGSWSTSWGKPNVPRAPLESIALFPEHRFVRFVYRLPPGSWCSFFILLVRFNISLPSFNVWLARFYVWLARFNVSVGI